MAKLVFLGRLADLAGRDEAELAAAVQLGWEDVLAWLGETFGSALVAAVRAEKVRIAVDGVLITDKASLALSGDDELAFLPPVSGG